MEEEDDDDEGAGGGDDDDKHMKIGWNKTANETRRKNKNGEKNLKPAQFEAGKMERTRNKSTEEDDGDDEQQHFKNKFCNEVYMCNVRESLNIFTMYPKRQCMHTSM